MKRTLPAVALTTWAALVALHLVWHGMPWPQHARAWAGLALGVVPLLLPLLALRRSLQHALLWLSLVALGYFCHGVVELVTGAGSPVFATIEVALVVVLVATLTVAMSREKRAQRGEPSGSLAGSPPNG